MLVATELQSKARVRTTCPSCSFELWHPIARLRNSRVGLYDDSRFPGRVIVSLDQHYDHLDEVPEVLLADFMADVARTSRVLRDCLEVPRVNVAILGNQERHVHAHLIPRDPTSDPLPSKSPWQDPRPRSLLDPIFHVQIVETLRARLSHAVQEH